MNPIVKNILAVFAGVAIVNTSLMGGRLATKKQS